MKLFKNWKTSAAGVGALFIAIGSGLACLSGTGECNWSEITGNVALGLAGLGLIAAPDAK